MNSYMGRGFHQNPPAPTTRRSLELAKAAGCAEAGSSDRSAYQVIGKGESPASFVRRGRTGLLAENLRERGLLELQFGCSKDAAQVGMSDHNG